MASRGRVADSLPSPSLICSEISAPRPLSVPHGLSRGTARSRPPATQTQTQGAFGIHFQHLKTVVSYRLYVDFIPQSRKQQDVNGSNQSPQDDFGSRPVAQKCGRSRNSNSTIKQYDLKQTSSTEHTHSSNSESHERGSDHVSSDVRINHQSWKYRNTSQDDNGSKNFRCGESFHAHSSTRSRGRVHKSEHCNGSSHSQQEFVGLTNTGVNCSVNVLLQTLYMIPQYKDIIMRYGRKSNQKEMDKSVLPKLYQVFQNLDSEKKAVRVDEFLQCLKLNHIKVEFQMDVEELFRSLMGIIHEEQEVITRSVNPAETEVEETNIFAFTAKDHTKCVECSSEITQKEKMLTVPLSLHNPACDAPYESMEKSFEAFFGKHWLDQDSKCYCDNCGQKTQTTQYCRMVSLPQVLCFHLKRFGYSTNLGKSVKICDSMTFSESYTIRIDEHNGQEDKYDLISVIVHRGTTYFGHYYAYIKHLPEKEWYCFNDERVTKVSWKDVEKSFGSAKYVNSQRSFRESMSHNWDETAYLLFYKRCR